MNKKEDFNSAMLRRSFLKRSAAAGLGVAAGFSLGNITSCSSPTQKIPGLSYLNERKETPVVKEADVVIIGGGISGLFAALTAGRMGVSTILVDRFGSLGGNFGPGYQVGGHGGYSDASSMLGSELPTVPLEFWHRLEKLSEERQLVRKHRLQKGRINHNNYADVSTKVSYLAAKMAEEAGIELILSVYGCDPIVENNVVKGVFVEGKSGRVAIKSKILIDATGNASIAERGGAGIIRYVSWDWTTFSDSPPEYDPESDYITDIPGRTKPEGAPNSELTLMDEAGIYMLIGNADELEYNRFVKENANISDDDRAWMEQNWPGPHGLQWYTGMPDAFIPLLRKAWAAGNKYNPLIELKEKGIRIASHWSHFGEGNMSKNIFYGRAPIAYGRIDMGNMDMVSFLEKEIRKQAFELVQFLKEYSPGFSQNSYLMFLSPFMGSRGGPCIEGEHILTIDDWADNRHFDDVIFQTIRTKRQVAEYAGEDWEPGLDVPYRIMLPKGFDNIYVVGRGASYIRRAHDGVGGLRGKPLMQALGQASGAAAAMCAMSGSSAQMLDIKNLQKVLLQQGFKLGDQERLRELKLV